MSNIPTHVRRHRQQQLHIIPEGWFVHSWYQDRDIPVKNRYYNRAVGEIVPLEGGYVWVVRLDDGTILNGQAKTETEAMAVADAAATRSGVY